MTAAGGGGAWRRPAWAEVDLGAIRHNAAALAALVRPAGLCAVVKADGYGHGAVAAARAALDGGATWLAVALVDEGLELREAGIEAPVLLLQEPPPDAFGDALEAGLTPTLYSPGAAEAAAKAAVAAGQRPHSVHVKVDTGMHRVGAPPEEAVALARAVDASPELALEGLWTHFAVADEPERAETGTQLRRFGAVVERLAGHGVRPRLLHAANSAGALAHPAARLDLVRCGIALYGYPPAETPPGLDLRPALSLSARVSLVRELGAGERLSYGLRHELAEATVVATVPLGYADGVRRGLDGTDVLVGGRRRPIVGTVTMDQVLVDCGPGSDVAAGDEVVLLGRQGAEAATAEDWAAALGTITYDVLTGIGARVPRRYRG